MPGLFVVTSLLSLLPADASAHGPALDRQLLLSLWIILALFALAHIILIVGLAARRHSVQRSVWQIEYLPLLALAILFAVMTVRAERLWAATRYTGASLTALQVEVTGVQFAWYFRYPGTDATFGRTLPQLVAPGEGNPLGIDPADRHSADDIVSSQLVLPIGREVDLAIRSQDVIHGFSVPEMRLKQNAVPGETIHIHFTPTAKGTYAILCTQVCGMGHYRMNANLHVVTPLEFDQWLAQREKAVQP
ncbi:cytochrome C oxidase subunit II [Edaphobacter sp.]|uniref:cytochrome c oxidase subunit II n=1 Tax=Edaphobacter sp. TaxID=1934404 RepID=UPI002DBF8C5A|nr:cytochrome C oxidase subunit II [Edaphobacter sp.]HEU5339873.1 cytochrome C oxidase subunit II [Edaphobacter sp.]